MILQSERSGRLMKTTTGYSAFVPNPLPPNPPLLIDEEIQAQLSLADRKLGRLDGIIQVLPNPELFLAMYVKKEAVLSSQIEGTQASLVDVLNVSDKDTKEKRNSVEDVVNYVHAVNWGLARLENLPMSLRLIREIHAVLLDGVRGSNKNPGEFRRSQNWIGSAGCNLQTATFVPPPAEQMLAAMNDLERFIYDPVPMPALIKIALIHAQFETIHPFLDGNGRMGRLLITFWLCQQEILTKPLLYLSYYFKKNRTEYYDLLMQVRLNGAWEKWVKFFLKGVAEVSDEATNSAKRIIQMKERHMQLLNDRKNSTRSHQQLLDLLFDTPIVTRKLVMEKIGVTSPTAGSLLDEFCELGILMDASPERQRNKEYYYQEYLMILEEGTELTTDQ